MKSTLFEIRPVSEEDVPVLLSLIKDLAEYERLSHEVVATEEPLRESLFGRRPFSHAVIGYYDDVPVRFAQ